ncbi:MAG: hypothetical protein IJ493_01600 [Clostridia bacterium]|nr:hypothetical protein [Clostridia bacterium]
MKKLILPLLLILLLLPSCGSGETAAQTQFGDFVLTLTTARTAYDTNTVDLSAPFEITATLVYKGETELTTDYAEPIFNFYIFAPGEEIEPLDRPAIVEQPITCTPGQVFTFFTDGAFCVNSDGVLPAGTYTAYVNVVIDGRSAELSLPFDVK